MMLNILINVLAYAGYCVWAYVAYLWLMLFRKWAHDILMRNSGQSGRTDEGA